jgi:Protein of unknown function (DUF992)
MAAVALALSLSASGVAADETETEDTPGPSGGGTSTGHAGVLECHTVPGSGYTILIHSSVDIVCLLRRPQGVEQYHGEMGIALGLDLQSSRDETIRFGVVGLARDPEIGSYALAGTYAGAKASVALSYGVGAEALIGGSQKGIALQPLGISTSEGYGLAAGLAYLVLRPGHDDDPASARKPPSPPRSIPGPPRPRPNPAPA